MSSDRQRSLTAKSARYLATLKREGAGRSLAEVCKIAGVSQSALRVWRRQVAGFADQEKAIRAEHEEAVSQAADPDDGPTFSPGLRPPPIDDTGLAPKLVTYLRTYQQTRDRNQALGAAQLTSDDVIEAERNDSVFQKQLDRVRREVYWQLEDQQVRKAAGGDAQAGRFVLNAVDPRFRGASEDGPAGGAPPAPTAEDRARAAGEFARALAAARGTPAPSPPVSERPFRWLPEEVAEQVSAPVVAADVE